MRRALAVVIAFVLIPVGLVFGPGISAAFAITDAADWATGSSTGIYFPSGLLTSADGTSLYVFNQGAYVYKRSTADGTAQTSPDYVSQSSSWNGALSPDGSKLYVTDQITGKVYVFSTSDNSLLATWTGLASAYGIAISPDGTKAYVTSAQHEGTSTHGKVFIINTSDGTQTAGSGSGNWSGLQLPRGIAVTADGTKVIVTEDDTSTTKVHNASDGSVSSTWGFTTSSPLSMSADRSRIYVNRPSSNDIYMVNPSTGSIATTISSNFNNVTGIASSPDNSTLYVINAGASPTDTGGVISKYTGIQQSALNPAYGTPTQTLDGFTVNITNYDGNYTWTPTVDHGSVSKGTASGGNLPLTVTGLSAGQSATITTAVTRFGYNDGTGTKSSAALMAGLTPAFDTPSKTADGFTVNVTNYDGNYTFTPSVNNGSVVAGTASGSTLPLTVSGLDPSQQATVTVTTTRGGYANGSGQVQSAAQQGAALTPTFSETTPEANGFTVYLTNYDRFYTYDFSTTAGSVVTYDPAPSGGAQLIRVNGVGVGGQSATLTATTTRSGYATGSGQVTGTSNQAALIPSFDTPVQTADGYTVNITNYDSNYTYALTPDHGTATQGTPADGKLPITITGLTPGQSASLEAKASRTGYNTGINTVQASAINGSALTPAFDTSVAKPNGFTVNVTNYDPDYTFTPSVDHGSVVAGTASGSTLPLTVSGLTDGQSATVTVQVTRTGYDTGSDTASGTANAAALNASFDTPVPTADGFTVNITNYDGNYTWTPTTNNGTVTKGTADGSTLPLTVTGLTPDQSATVSVSTTRTGFNNGSGSVQSSALKGTALTPAFDAPVRGPNGFTFNLTNYDPNYTFTPSVDHGSIVAGTASGSTLPFTVSGLTDGQSATATVQVTRSGYDTGSDGVTSSAYDAAVTPTFDTPVPTTNGFTVNVTNYDAGYIFTLTVNHGAVVAGDVTGSTLPLTVGGLTDGQSATITVTTSRTGHVDGSATVAGSANEAALNPSLSTPVATDNGFTLEISNYDSNFTFTPSVDHGSVVAGTASGSTLPLTVSGLTDGESATVTVTTTRTNYNGGSATMTGAAKSAALTAGFDTPVATADGFTVNVTNYDSNFGFAPTVDHGSVTAGTAVGSTLPLTVTGLTYRQSATVTVDTTRADYKSGSNTLTAQADFGPAYLPAFDTPVQTADGFTVNITNYDSDYTFTPSVSNGAVSAGSASGSNLPLTVTGLSPAQPAQVQVTVTRATYADGSADVSDAALTGAALIPAFGNGVAKFSGFTVEVTNYNPLVLYNANVNAGSVSAHTQNGVMTLTVTGLAASQSATITLQTMRTGYFSGSADYTAASLSTLIQQLCPTGSCNGVDLSNRDLSNQDLSGLNMTNANLSGTNFSGSNLSGVTITDSSLVGADFRNSNLTRANFANDNLADVNMSGSNLTNANFSGNANWTPRGDVGFTVKAGANLRNANLARANLTGANFKGARLQHANLTKAKMVRTNLVGAKAGAAVFKKANLLRANLSHGNFVKANFAHASLRDSNLKYANFTHANLTRTNLTHAQTAGTRF